MMMFARSFTALITFTACCWMLPITSSAQAPSFGGVTTNSSGSDVTSLSISVPASTVADDLLVTFLSTDGSETHNTPAGWTRLGQQVSGGEMTFSAYYRLATAGEPASYTFTWGSAEQAVIAMLRYTGVNPTNPIVSGSFDTGTTISPTAPDAYVPSTDTRLVRVFGADDDDDPVTHPGGTTERVERASNTGSGTTLMGVADAVQLTPGTVGSNSFTMAAADQWVGLTLALRGANAVQDLCGTAYVVADNGGGNGGNDLLSLVDPVSGLETPIGTGLGVSSVEAIAFDPFTEVLYAANGGDFGTIDIVSGEYSSIGPFGSGNGSLGTFTINDVDSLSLDPYSGVMYGADRNSSTNDLLVAIDPVTGGIISNFFGAGVDYVPVQIVSNLLDIDDIAIDPYDGQMYGVANDSGSDDILVSIDKATGAAVAIGVMGVNDHEGLGFNNFGQLFGTTGSSEALYDVDKTSGVASNGRPLNVGSDYESADALVCDPNEISGTVFFDEDQNTVFGGSDVGESNVTVRLYRDANTNGVVDVGDILVDTRQTDANGDYLFRFAGTGAFAVDIETNDLPGTHFLTTDNIETANFGNSFGLSDVDNDFGYGLDAAVSLIKLADAALDGETNFVSSGANVVYTYEVVNQGLTYLSSITVTDDVLGVIGSIPGPVAPGVTNILLATNLNVTADVTNIGVVDANPTESDGTDLAPLSNVGDTDDAVTDVLSPAIGLIKLADSAPDGTVNTILSGDNVVYSYEVVNSGDTFLSSITVTDDVLGVVGTIPGPVAPGVTNVLLATNLNVTADVTNIGVVDANPTDSGGTDLPGFSNVDDTDDAVTELAAPGVSLIKLADSAPDGTVNTILSGDNVVYSYEVVNVGDTFLSSITVTDDVLGVVGTIPGPVAPGVTNVLLATNLNVTADVTNIGVVDANPTDSGGTDLPNLSNVGDNDDAVTELAAPAVSLIKLADSAPDGSTNIVSSGANVVYSYEVVNAGDTFLSSITVTDDVLGVVGTIPGPVAPGVTNVLLATNLNVTADVTNIGVVDANPTDGGGTDLPNLSNVGDTDDAITELAAPAVNLIKLADSAADGSTNFISSGANVVYSYEVVNIGDTFLSSITVTDDVLGVVGTIPGPVAPGVTNVLLATNLNVTADVTNIGVVDANPTDSGGTDIPGLPNVNDNDDAVTELAAPGVSLIKLADSAPDGTTNTVLSGANVVYTYEVVNAGDTFLSSITVTDDVLGVVGTIPGPVAPGSTNVLLATNLNVTADVTNIGVVDANPTDSGGTDLPNLSNVGDTDDAVTELIPANLSIGDLVFLDLDQDGIQDGGAEVGVTNVLVTLYDAATNVITSQSTDSSGNYLFTNLTAGTYLVGITPPANFAVTAKDQVGTEATDSDVDPTTLLTDPIVLASSTVDVDAGIFDFTGDPCGRAYVVADNEAGEDQLSLVNPVTGLETPIGGLTATNVEAIAFSPMDGVLYAMDNDVLGTIDTATGVFSPIGVGAGTVDGSIGSITINDVDSLTVDPHSGIIYGAERNSSTNDLLFAIDPITGAHIPDFFGPGVDYQAITINSNLLQIDDIAIDPYDGTLYGIQNDTGGGDDQLVTIDKTSGVATVVGVLGVNDHEGLGFNNLGELFGTTGGSGSELYDVDKTTGVASNPRPLNFSEDYEAADALVCDPNLISGTVFFDDNTDGAFNGADVGESNVTVRLYRDANTNGVVDVGDILLTTQQTDSNGDYLFELAATGAFVLDIATNDLPDTHFLTTDNIEAADFGTSFGQSDVDNDFGYGLQVGVLLIKLADSTPDGETNVVSSGANVVYQYSVINTGLTYLSSITVTDDVLGVVGSIPGPVAPGSTNVLLATNLNVTADVTNIGVVDANPTESDGTDLPTLSNVGDDDDAVTELAAPGINLIKLADSAADGSTNFISSGANVVYSYEVVNVGDTFLSSITVTDDVLGVVGTIPGPVAPGVTNVLLATNLNVTADVTNIGVVDANPTDSGGTDIPGLPNVDDTDDAVTELAAPGVSLIKLADAAPDGTTNNILSGDNVVYSYEVVNVGDTFLSSITVTDDVLGVVGSIPGPVAPGSTNVLLATNLNVTADVTNIGVVDANPTDDGGTDLPNLPNVGDNDDAVTELVAPGVSLIKLADAAPDGTTNIVSSGDNVVYSYEVVNIGDTFLSSITVTDDVLGVVGTITGPVAPGVTNVLFATNLNVTADVTNIGVVDANPTDSGGTDIPGIPNVGDTDDAITELVAPAIQLTKLADTAPDGTTNNILSGANVVYTYEVVNIGDTFLSSITVTDDVLGVVGTLPGPVAPGSTNVFLATNLNVTADVTNIGVVDANPTDSGGTDIPGLPNVDDTDDAITELVAPAVQLIKLADAAPDGTTNNVLSGANVVYTYEVVNIGDTFLSSITVTDDVLGVVGTLPGPVAPGVTNVLLATNLNVTADVTNIGVVDANPTDPVGVDLPNIPNVSDSDDAVTELSAPDFELVKTVASPTGRAAEIGEAVVFNIVITNSGDVALVTVPVEDTYDTSILDFVSAIPATVDTVDDGTINWTDVGPLPVGATTTLVVNFTAAASTAGANETNTVVASPTTPPTEPPVDPKTNEVPYAVSNPDYDLSKDIISPTVGTAAGIGDSIVFNITVTNTGDVVLSTVPVEDTYDTSLLDFVIAVPPTVDVVDDGAINWTDVGPLPVGASTTLVVNFTAAASTMSLAETNTAVASPTTPPTEPPVDPKTNEAPYEISNVDFELIKETVTPPSGDAAQVGDPVVFNITVTNSGEVVLSTVPVEDVYDNTLLTFVSAVPATVDTVNDGTINWTDVGPLPVGASTTLVVNFTAAASTMGTMETNTVVASPTTPPAEPPVAPKTNDAPYQISDSDYSVFKMITSPVGRAAEIGEAVVFSIVVTNSGDVALVTVPVEDQYDNTVLTFVSAVPATVDTVNDGTINWTDVGPVPIGASTTLVVNFTAAASTAGTLETNVVVASPTVPPMEPPVPPKTNDVPYAVSNPDYELDKVVVTPPAGTAAGIGDSIVFNITVTNSGDVVLSTVPVTDTYDTSLLDFVSAVPASDDIVDDGQIDWTDVGPLPVGASTTLVVNFTAAASTMSAVETNTAVTAPTTPPNEPPVDPKTNEAPYEISNADYEVTKTVSSPTGRAADIGEAVVFNIVVTNSGDVVLSTVPVEDTYDTSILDFVSAVPATVDTVDDGTINWTDVGPLPVGASTTLVVNFTAAASTMGMSETNTVVASPTTPPTEPPVPPKTNDVPYDVSNPDYELSKTVASPSGRAAQVGEAVVFNIVVTNSGDVVLSTVPVEDTYDTSILDFVSAVPATVDTVDDGTINWTDVGPLPVGASTTLVVNFTAAASTMGMSETNTVVASPTTPPTEPPVPPKTNDVPYDVSVVGYTLTKTLLSPTNAPPIIGQPISFNIEVVNTGEVNLVTVPVVDSYDPALISYVGAVPASDDNVDDGVIDWANIGPLSVGSSTSIVVNFTAVGGTMPVETNTAVTTPTTPPTEPPVPPQTSSVPYVIDTPTAVGDFVWIDQNANGIQDPEDLTNGVSGVTVELYDADTNFVDSTTTGANGFYIFTNLTPDVYFVDVLIPAGFEVSPQDQGGDDSTDSDIDPVTGQTAPTNVMSGMAVLTLDAGIYQPVELGDLVFLDEDGDGIQDGGEPGVTNVTVTLYDADTNALDTTTTDSLGMYAFTNLTPGTYFVGFTPPAGTTLTTPDQGGDDTLDSDADPVTGYTPPVTLNSGESTDDLDAGLYVPAVLGDFIWDDLNGNGIQDPEDLTNGLVGVTVDLFDGMTNPAGSTVTGPNGVYLFTNLPPNDYFVVVTPPAGSTPSPQDQGGDTTDSDLDIVTSTSDPVTLASGVTNLTLDGGFFFPASLGDRVWFDENGNGIQDPTEITGLENVVVTLYDAATNAVDTTTTDAAGNYAFTNLVPGVYSVGITPPFGFTVSPQDQGGDDTTDSDIDPTSNLTAPVTLVSGENNPTLDAGLFEEGTLAGTIFHDENDDGTDQIAETTFGNVTVQLFDAGPNMVPGGGDDVLIDSMETDTSGNYLFTGLLPGKYFVDVVDSTVPAGFDVASNYTDPTTVEMLTSGQDVTDVDVGYLNPNPLTGIIGDYVWIDTNGDGIQDPSEIGVEGVELTLWDVGPDGVFGTPDDVSVTTTTTDPTGHYIFPNVPAGTYVVEVTDVSGTPIASFTPVSGPQSYLGNTTPITITGGEVVLDADFGYTGGPLGSIGDTVFLDTNGNGTQDGGENGIPGVTVNLLDDMGAVLATLTTGPNGDYLFDGLPAGDYEVDVTDQNMVLDGYTLTSGTPNTNGESQTDPFPVTLGAGQNVDFADFGYQPPPGSIGNQIFIDSNGDGVFDPNDGDTGLGGVTVQLFDSMTNLIDSVVTNPDGTYLFTGLDPDSYVIAVDPSSVPPALTPGPLGTPGLDNNSQAPFFPVVLGPGDSEVAADFGYESVGSVTIGDTVYYDWDSSGMQDTVTETNSGIPNITLELYIDTNGDMMLDGGDILVGTDVTDTNGMYQFTGLAPTNYVINLLDPNNLLDDTTQTQGTLPQPVDVTDGLDDLDVDFGFVPIAPLGAIGDTVWIDAGNGGIPLDGQPNENLASAGINGVTVRLFDPSSNLVATAVTTNGPGGQRGYYLFDNQPFGEYFVEVDFTTVPPLLQFNTTALRIPVTITPTAPFVLADFGFRPSNPTAVELTAFAALAEGDQIRIQWSTALELGTLGFRLLRSEDLQADPVSVMPLVYGEGSESGADYEWVDTDVTSGAVYYYWLEEEETDGDRILYGPITASLDEVDDGDVLGSFTAPVPGVYRIGYDLLLDAGIPASQLDADQLQVLVDGQEVEVMVTAESGTLQTADYILFYAENADAHVELRMGEEGARMAWTYVRPRLRDGEVWMGSVLEEGVTPMIFDPAVSRHMLVGFSTYPIWLLDVTDPVRPVFLYGFRALESGDSISVYFDLDTSSSSHGVAVDGDSIIDVETIHAE